MDFFLYDVDMHGYMYVFWMYGDFIISWYSAIVNLIYCVNLFIINEINHANKDYLEKIFMCIRFCRSVWLHIKDKEFGMSERSSY